MVLNSNWHASSLDQRKTIALVLSHNALSSGKVLGTHSRLQGESKSTEATFTPTSITSHRELHIQELGKYKAAPPPKFFAADLCQLRLWIAFRHLF